MSIFDIYRKKEVQLLAVFTYILAKRKSYGSYEAAHWDQGLYLRHLWGWVLQPEISSQVIHLDSLKQKSLGENVECDHEIMNKQ